MSQRNKLPHEKSMENERKVPQTTPSSAPTVNAFLVRPFFPSFPPIAAYEVRKAASVIDARTSLVVVSRRHLTEPIFSLIDAAHVCAEKE